MHFSKSITFSADGSAASATETEMPISHGVVTNVQVNFPSGCWGLVRVKIFDKGHQAWPLSLGSTYAANNETVNVNEFHEIKAVPAKLVIWGYNADQAHDHKITVRVAVLPKLIAAPYIVMRTLVDALKAILT